jgi:O-antigen/teichoic acid export membrane protein
VIESREESEAAPEAPARLARAARTDRQLLARSSITLVSRGFSKFAQIFFLVIAARLLSVEEFASYSYLIVLAAAFTIMSDTGVPLVSGRDASQGRASFGELFWAALPIVLVTAVAAAVLLAVFGAIDAGPGSTAVPVLLTALFVLANRVLDLICQLLRGVGRFELEAGLQVANAVAFIGGSVAVIAAGYGVTAVIAVFFLKELACLLAGWWAVRHEIGTGPPAHSRATGWRGLVGIGLRLAAAGIGLALAMRVPLAVLGNSGTPEELALFSAAQRFGDGAYVLAITGGFALMPGLAFLGRSEPARARRLVRRVLVAVVAGTVALAAVSAPLAEPIMRGIFGAPFGDGADLFIITVAGLPACVALAVCWYAIVAFDGEARLVAVGVGSLVVSVGLSLALIPSGGDAEAALAYTATLYAAAVLGLVALRRQLRRGAEEPAHA